MTAAHPDPLHALDNPIWHALTTAQAGIAQGGALKYYPAAMAPFCAVADAAMELDVSDVAGAGAGRYFLGVIPERVPGFALEELTPVLQLVHDGKPRVAAPVSGAPVLVQGDADVPALLELINLAYPGYFRSQTASLGRYIGIVEDGQLVAMAGQRMHMAGYREISGVCTRPGFTGKGYAGRLLAWLVDDILRQGERPLLHVNADNHRALGLYEELGFVTSYTLRHARLAG